MSDEAPLEVQVCMKNRPNQRVCCVRNGSKRILRDLKTEIEKHDLNWTLKEAFCMGHCSRGPNISVPALDKTFHHVEKDRVSDFVAFLQKQLADA